MLKREMDEPLSVTTFLSPSIRSYPVISFSWAPIMENRDTAEVARWSASFQNRWDVCLAALRNVVEAWVESSLNRRSNETLSDADGGRGEDEDCGRLGRCGEGGGGGGVD